MFSFGVVFCSLVNSMRRPVQFAALFVILGAAATQLQMAHASSAPTDSVLFCVPFDYEQWRREHPLPAGKWAADLNMGAPRTIRMIYFLPNDRPFRPEVVDSIKVRIRQVQRFFVDQMEAHGYGRRVLRIEVDSQGEPLVHRVNGQHPNSHYLDDTHVVYDEIEQIFDRQENIYVVVVDHSLDGIGIGGGVIAGGTGGGYKKAGSALVPSSVNYATVAHELGHAFGLLHDFRDDEYIMSYGGRERSSLSACAAQFLTVHPYFNDESALEAYRQRAPSVELVSSQGYAAGAANVPIQLRVGASDGLHQAILFAVTRDIGITAGGSEIKTCHGLPGGRDAVVEFQYDGVIPSSLVSSLSDPPVHPIRVQVVNSEGDVGRTNFALAEISPHLIRTLGGHRISVNSVAYSPDGRTLASGSDGAVVLWDVSSGQEKATFQGRSGEVYSVAYSPDGHTLAGGSDGAVVLWDVSSGQEKATLYTSGVTSVAFSPDGRTLAGGSDGAVVLWDVSSGQEKATLYTSGVTSVAFSPDGRTLASGSHRGTVVLWDVKSAQFKAALKGHTSAVTSVAISPEGGGTIYSSSLDRTVILWDVATRSLIATLEGHGSRVTSLSLSASDGGLLATGGADGTITLWDILTREKITVFGHTSGIESVSLPPRGSLLAGLGGGEIRLWDISKWTGPRPYGLEIISGDSQQGAPGAVLAKPLVVEVRDQFGDPLPNASVTFTVTVGEGKLSGRFTVQHATSDADGRVALPVTLGLLPGPNAVTVSIGGRDLGTFTAQGVGTAVAELIGDYRTWDLPAPAVARLGKGALGESDRPLALSASGRYLAVASRIGAWLYEASTSRTLALLKTERPVHSVAFSPRGILATGLDNGHVELWDVEAFASIGTLRHSDWARITAAIFSPDGSRVASASWDQIIKLWDVETRREMGTWEVPREDNSLWSLSVAFSPDGRRLASGFQDGTVRLWDVAMQKEVATLAGHNARVTSVAFSPDGSLLASGGGWGDRTVRLWNVSAQEEVAALTGHTSEVLSVSFSSPDGAILASAGGEGDATVRLWNVATGRAISNLEEHTGAVYSVVFARDGATLVSGATDGTVLLRDLATGNAAGLSGHGSLTSMALSPDGALMATGFEGGTVRLWDAVIQTEIAALKGQTVRADAMAFSPDGKSLVSTSWRTIKLWDVATRELIGTLEGHTDIIKSTSFSPNGSTLASGAFDRTVKLWDVATRELIGTLEGHTDWVEAVSFSPDGTTLAAGLWDGTVTLWKVATREQIHTLKGHDYEVETVAFSHDGKTLASGSADTKIRLWDVATRNSIATLQDVNTVLHVAFSSDGKSLVSGSHRTVTLWDVATGSRITTLEGHSGSVEHAAFWPDGATLASGSDDGTMLLWDMQRVLVRPHTLAPVSGLDQEGAPGARLSTPFVVLVKDQNGDPFAGATVTFAVVTGGGKLTMETAETDSSGKASTTLTLGTSAGTNSVAATVSGVRETVTFIAQALATPDFDGDGSVGFPDFLQFAAKFGLRQGDAAYDARFDLDGNGTIGFSDFLIFAASFGQGA